MVALYPLGAPSGGYFSFRVFQGVRPVDATAIAGKIDVHPHSANATRWTVGHSNYREEPEQV